MIILRIIQVSNAGAARGSKRAEPYLARSKLRKKKSTFDFWQISCIQPHQNITATLSYPTTYLILSHSTVAREGTIFVKILNSFDFFASC